MSNTPYQTTRVVSTIVGGATTDYVGFYGADASSTQRSSSVQGTLSISAITSTTPYGFASKADADAMLDQLAEVVATLTAVGLWKGSA